MTKRSRARRLSPALPLLSLLALAALLPALPARAQSAPDAPAAASADAPPDSLGPAPIVASDAPARPAMNTHPVVATRRVRFNQKSQNVVRSGPGSSFSIVGVYARGATFPVIAKSGDWYNVRLSDSETGWVHSSLCQELDDTSGLEFKPNPKLFSRTGTFILTGYAGAYAFDRKSNSLALGGRLGYYMFDRLQAEGGVAWTRVNRPAEIVESLFDLSLEAEKFDMLFYHMNLTYELLPGRQMVPFFTGGVGSTLMLGRSEFSYNFGAGTTLFLSKRTAMRWEFRDYRFKSGPDDARVQNDNVEFTLGSSLLF
ncbi:MAG TPA: outer membrane beta-barrel domain-containing protein [Candidatus Saccharimonadaceae bacterium]|jgi:outer membrane beta-barrel protein|nr:outer membrane beta-barrel domain-containing protein [Candidatus Saccharimonadaceae bacterium]